MWPNAGVSTRTGIWCYSMGEEGAQLWSDCHLRPLKGDGGWSQGHGFDGSKPGGWMKSRHTSEAKPLGHGKAITSV